MDKLRNIDRKYVDDDLSNFKNYFELFLCSKYYNAIKIAKKYSYFQIIKLNIDQVILQPGYLSISRSQHGGFTIDCLLIYEHIL